MIRFLESVLLILMLAVSSGAEKQEYSENILLSLNNGAAGFGTMADCTDATIMIYTDRTVKVFMDIENCPEIASLELSEEEYEEILEIASPKEISNLKVRNDMDVCDGSSYYITLYDKNDKELLSKGGYMPEGKKFWNIYRGIKEILAPYDINEIVDEYRKTLEFDW